MIKNLIILYLISFSTSAFAYQGNICIANQIYNPTLQMCKAKNNNAFTHNYVDNSPIQTVSLKYTIVKLKIYYNGNPKGLSEVMTDENQQFILEDYQDKHSLAFDIISIGVEQKNLNIYCYDISGPNKKHEIFIRCAESKV